MDSAEDTAAADAPPPVPTSSLFAELGLAPEDVDALAQIPENEISIETLPYLIMQLKAKKASIPTPTTTKSDTDARRADDSNNSTSSSRHDDTHTPSGGPSSSSATSRPWKSPSGTPRIQKDDDAYHKTRRDYSRFIKSLRDKWYPKSLPKMPFNYQVSDFHGNVPHTFPHTCGLCHCRVNSKTTWKDHLRGVRHDCSKKELLRLFPSWDPYQQGASSQSLYPNDTDRRPGRSLKHPSRNTGGALPSSDMSIPKRVLSGPQKPLQRPVFRTRVVVTKFPLGSVTVRDLLELAEPFGTVVKHLVFPSKGFLEFSSHTEAHAMVSHFYDKLDFTKQHKIYVYLSPNVASIQIPGGGDSRSQSRSSKTGAVLFTRLPDKKDTEEKVLEVVKMFGDVRRSKFSGSEAQVEMVDREDARLMVKYYYDRPLKILGTKVKVTMLPDPKHSLRDSPERSHSGSRHKSEDQTKPPSSSSSSKDKSGDATDSSTPSAPVEQVSDETRLEEKPAKGGPRGEASQPDAEWADLREEDLDPEDVEEMELGEEEEDLDEEDGIPVEDERGLVEEEGSDEPTEVTEGSEVTHGEERAEPSEGPAPDAAGTAQPEQASGDEDNQQEDAEMSDFPDNLDDFVTLDELDSGTDMLETNDFQGGKVILVRPVKGYAPEEALRKLATPFGKVINHTISRYRQEALLELETEEQVKEMVAFYKGSKDGAIINGRPVTVSLCRTLKELEGPSGCSIYISNLPMGKFSDIALLWMARPFGSVKAYRINRGPRSCYVQFHRPEAAEKMLKKYGTRPPKFKGAILTVCPCRKPDSTISWITPSIQLGAAEGKELEENGGEERERRGSKRKREESTELEGRCGDPAPVEPEEGDEKEKKEKESEEAEECVDQPGTPVGVDYIVPASGFFCKLCNVFYTRESTAKSQHCSSTEHHKNLKAREKRRRSSSASSPKASERSKPDP
ncbi:matrin-3 [Sardina pilchardus]|uniref:matrin-3 n=1 Tax=Sardina pilchardus TaxID=27697 RepID=UPI002E15B24A